MIISDLKLGNISKGEKSENILIYNYYNYVIINIISKSEAIVFKTNANLSKKIEIL